MKTIGAIVAMLISLGSLGVSYWALVQSRQALDQTRQLTESQHDIDLLGRFADFYFASGESRRYTFALHVVDKMNDPGFRRGLRIFVFSGMMTRNFRIPTPVIPFDKDNDDWRVAGDALGNLRRFWSDEAERQTFSDWWCDQKQRALTRWPRHRKHLMDLYGYLDDQFLDDRNYKYLQSPLPKILPCDLATKQEAR